MIRKCSVCSALLALVALLGACGWKHVHRRSAEAIVEKFGEYHRKFGEIAVGRPILLKDPSAMKVDLGFTARQLYDDIALDFAGRVGRFDVRSFRGALKFEAPTVTIPAAQPSLKEEIASQMAQALLEKVAAGGDANGAAALAEVLKSALLPNASVSPAAADAGSPSADGAAAPAPETASAEAQGNGGAAAPITRSALGLPDLPENAAAARVAELADEAGVFAALPEVELSQPLRMRQATNNYSLMKLIELGSDPNNYRMPKGHEAVLVIGNITVSPGTITRRSFVAEVSLKFTLTDEEGDTVKRSSGASYKPSMVRSLLPSGFGQNMNLQSLTASQRDLALALSAAGYVAAGQALLASSELMQRNLQSVNQRVSIAAFQRGSTNEFGYRIRGEQWAVNPDSFDPEAVDLLQEVNLPYAVIATIPYEGYKKDVARGLAYTGSNAAPTILRPGTDLFWRLSVETRWIPADERKARDAAWWYPELNLMEGMYRAHAADSLYAQSERWIDESKGKDTHHWREQWARNAVDAIFASGVSAYNYVLPLEEEPPKTPGRPFIGHVYPETVPHDRPSVVLVTGSDFGAEPVFTFAGVPGKLIGTFADGAAAAVTVDPSGLKPIWPATGRVAVAAEGGAAENSVIVFTFSSPPSSPAATPTTMIKKDGQPVLTIEEQAGGARREIFERSELEALIRDLIEELRKP